MTITAPPPMLTPPRVAQHFGVSADKVRAWITSGQLDAIDVSTRPGGRPRWRISEANLLEFEARRAATPPPKPKRRRRRDPAITEYF